MYVICDVLICKSCTCLCLCTETITEIDNLDYFKPSLINWSPLLALGAQTGLATRGNTTLARVSNFFVLKVMSKVRCCDLRLIIRFSHDECIS